MRRLLDARSAWMTRAPRDDRVKSTVHSARMRTRSLYSPEHGGTTKELGAGDDSRWSRAEYGGRSRDWRSVPTTRRSGGGLARVATDGSTMGVGRQASVRTNCRGPSPISSQQGSTSPSAVARSSSSDRTLNGR